MKKLLVAIGIAWAIVAVVGAAVCGVAILGGFSTAGKVVRYDVSGPDAGDCRFDVTYRTSDGATQQEAGVRSGWCHRFIAFSRDEPWVHAQASSRNCYGVDVAIVVDGQIWKQASSRGEYVVAEASGRL